MKSGILKLIRPASNRSAIFKKKLTTFFLCLLVSVFAWLVSALSKRETTKISFLVEYINLPKDRVVSNRLPDSISVEMESNGFNLMRYHYKARHEKLRVDASAIHSHKTSGYKYFTLDEVRSKINKQISNAKILRLAPDTIFLSFSKKITKTVPVKTKLRLTFQPQFHLSDSIKIEPEFIKVSGSAELIEKVNFIEVDLTFKNLSKTVVKKFPTRNTNASRQLEYSRDSVTVTIPVSEFTEAEKKVPIELANVPGNYTLKVFPSEVTVRYQVAFDKFNSVKPEQFRAVVDFSKAGEGAQLLKVDLLQKPSYIRNARVVPEKVEFLPIRK